MAADPVEQMISLHQFHSMRQRAQQITAEELGTSLQATKVPVHSAAPQPQPVDDYDPDDPWNLPPSPRHVPPRQAQPPILLPHSYQYWQPQTRPEPGQRRTQYEYAYGNVPQTQPGQFPQFAQPRREPVWPDYYYPDEPQTQRGPCHPPQPQPEPVQPMNVPPHDPDLTSPLGEAVNLDVVPQLNCLLT